MSALSWLGETKKTEGCRSHWRPLGGISEHFTGLFRLTFISIAMDGSLQSVLTLWPLPLFALSLGFFFFEENSERRNVSQIWKYYFRLSSLPGLPCGIKSGFVDSTKNLQGQVWTILLSRMLGRSCAWKGDCFSVKQQPQIQYKQFNSQEAAHLGRHHKFHP